MQTLGANRFICVWLGLIAASGCSDDDAGGEMPDDAGRGGSRAGAPGAGAGARSGSGGRAGAGEGGRAGSSAGSSGASSGSGGAGGTSAPRDLGYVGCPDFFTCACLVGGDHAQPWHVCAPPCDPDMDSCEAPDGASARAECQPQPVSVLGKRFPESGEGACVLHCDGDRTCPDGLTCVSAGQGTELCVESSLVPYPVLLAPVTDLHEPPTLAAERSELCEPVLVDGALRENDPSYRRAAQDASGCMLSPHGSNYRYDLYAYELVGDGPHELVAHTCASPAAFDTVINIYQDREGSESPLDLADPCTHLAAVADDSVFCEGGASLVRATGLAAGVVLVMVTSFDPGETGSYELTISSSTSTCQ